MRQPYTGCNPRGMTLSRDKVLSKQILAWHRIPTPQFALFRRRRRPSDPAEAALPIVGEVGNGGRLARHRTGLGRGRCAPGCSATTSSHEQTHSDALVEEFVDGRRLLCRRHRDEELTTLAPWSCGSLAARVLAGHRHPQGGVDAYQEKHGIGVAIGQRLPDGVPGPPRPHGAAHLPRLAHERLCPHGHPHAQGRVAVLPRGQCQPEPRASTRTLGARPSMPASPTRSCCSGSSWAWPTTPSGGTSQPFSRRTRRPRSARRRCRPVPRRRSAQRGWVLHVHPELPARWCPALAA